MTGQADSLDLRLLGRLLERREFRTISELARECETSFDEIGRRIQAFISAGCEIERHPQQGVRLLQTSLSCWADYLEPRHPGGIGRRTLVYQRTGSTQDAAKHLVTGHAAPSDLDGTLVVADQQTAGRGRLGRRWFSPPGASLLFTAVLSGTPITVDRLCLGSCLAIAETVERLTGATVRIRWPNDVMLDGRKLAGILVETVNGAALLGVGLNVHLPRRDLPDDIRRISTDLASTSASVDRLHLLDQLIMAFDSVLTGRPDDQLAGAWRQRSSLIEQRLTVEVGNQRLTGRVIDVDPQHGLMLAVEHGPVTTLPAASTRLILP